MGREKELALTSAFIRAWQGLAGCGRFFSLDSSWGWPPMLCVLFSQWAAGPDPAAGLPAHRGLRHLLQLLLLGLHREEYHGVRWRRRSSLWMPGEHRREVSEVSPQVPPLSVSHPPPFTHLFHTYSHPYVQTNLCILASEGEWFCATRSIFTESPSLKEP